MKWEVKQHLSKRKALPRDLTVNDIAFYYPRAWYYASMGNLFSTESLIRLAKEEPIIWETVVYFYDFLEISEEKIQFLAELSHQIDKKPLRIAIKALLGEFLAQKRILYLKTD